MQGASALNELLDKHPQDLRIFVVWEPVLATDLAAPSTATLDRLPDRRVTQYWDPTRLLSRTMGEREHSGVVWDYIAVYKPGDVWAEAPPKPIFEGFPVVHSLDDAAGVLTEGKH